MKIGIITWSGSPNYGTCLQAIALQRYLRNCGNDVEIINFDPPYVEQKKKSFYQRLKSKPKEYRNNAILKKHVNARNLRNDSQYKTVHSLCDFTRQINSDLDYINVCNSFDVVSCGSDQVWNPNWYHKYYYADLPGISALKISYAPSMGVNALTQDKKELIKHSLKDFKAISVREEQGEKLLREISPVEPVTVLDPVFLLSKDEWLEISKSSKYVNDKSDYVLCMLLVDKSEHYHAAENFAKKHNLKLKIIPYFGMSYVQKAEICEGAGLEDFLNLIKNSQYVITDSFHVLAFCLIFNKQFYVFQRFKENRFTSQNSRITDLLNKTGTKDRYVTYGSRKINDRPDIDFNGTVNRSMDELIVKSKKYLHAALDKCKNCLEEKD